MQILQMLHASVQKEPQALYILHIDAEYTENWSASTSEGDVIRNRHSRPRPEKKYHLLSSFAETKWKNHTVAENGKTELLRLNVRS